MSMNMHVIFQGAKMALRVNECVLEIEVVLLYWGNECPVSAAPLLIIAIDLTPHSWQYAATTKNEQILLLK